MMPGFICAATEVALNRTLRLEPEVLAELTRLKGRVLGLQVEVLGWEMFVEIIDDGVRVMPVAPVSPNVSLRGSPVALAQMARGLASGELHLPPGVQVAGELDLAQRFLTLLQRVGVTPDEVLAKVLGNAGAVRLVGGLSSLFKWGQSSSRELVHTSAEFLREESYTLARARDAEQWMQQVRKFAEGIDRLEARVQKLERGP